jgi:aminopeptidase N
MMHSSASWPLYALALVFCTAVTQPLHAESVFSFDSASGRLPKTVVPQDYRIAIVPHARAHRLSGTESILLDFRQASATIVFNSLNETLRDVRLDGQPVKGVASDDHTQLTTVTLAAPATTGAHTLSFSYNGRIGTSPVGLFVQDFVKPGGASDFMLSTQFEATDARRMFPCWDEPAFRATFELTVTVPSGWTAVSNMPVAQQHSRHGLTTTSFRRTPRMPSYLLELSAGDLARVTTQAGTTELNVWAVRGQEQQGATALANARQILADYNDYFGVPFPLPKLDSIAVPGGFQGAMENWGAITYNDLSLLLAPSSTLRQRQGVFSTQAHEMAHQWNGDLVTMGWWDDLWLNESFASWREISETDSRNPGWKWWEAADADKEAAMRADALASSIAIQQHVSDELQASAAFDPDITYSKGQAVLRMLEAYIGPDMFRDGIRRYMKAHAYSNATSADLWAALSETAGHDVAAVAAGWTEQPGFPLVSVHADCDADGSRTLHLSQQRFLVSGTDTAHARWSIPLQIRVGTKGSPHTVLLTADGQTVTAGHCDEALSANADAIGFYRVRYDNASLQTITQAFSALPDADRIALLDDQWAQAEAGTQELSSYLSLAAAMGDSLDERAWTQIAEALETIEYSERGAQGHDAFTAYARTILKPLADRLGWDVRPDEMPATQTLRRTVLSDLGDWGDANVVAQARKRFTAFLADRRSLSPDDQAIVLRLVALDADATTFEQLHRVARSAHNEAELRRYYLALTNVRDAQLAAQVAQFALSPELPANASGLRLGIVRALHERHPKLAWDLFSRNSRFLLGSEGSWAPSFLAQQSPQLFWDALPLDQLEAWSKARLPAAMAAELAHGMETAHALATRKTLLVQSADRFLSTHAAQSPSPAAG